MLFGPDRKTDAVPGRLTAKYRSCTILRSITCKHSEYDEAAQHAAFREQNSGRPSPRYRLFARDRHPPRSSAWRRRSIDAKGRLDKSTNRQIEQAAGARCNSRSEHNGPSRAGRGNADCTRLQGLGLRLALHDRRGEVLPPSRAGRIFQYSVTYNLLHSDEKVHLERDNRDNVPVKSE